jgi:predicted ABC-type sugar transport system permease subunit
MMQLVPWLVLVALTVVVQAVLVVPQLQLFLHHPANQEASGFLLPLAAVCPES